MPNASSNISGEKASSIGLITPANIITLSTTNWCAPIGDSQLCFSRCDAVEDEGYLVPFGWGDH